MEKMNNFIGYFNIGFSGGAISNRNIGYDLKEIGWREFIDRWVKPLILEKGVSRIELHNPAGTLPNEDMQADQFIHARRQGLDWVSKDFISAWRPITAMKNVEIISYLGLMHTDADFSRLKLKRNCKDNWLYRVYDAYRLPMDAGMSIGFDAIHHEPEESPEHHFVKMVSGLGLKTYIEPWPHKDCPHWFQSNHITVNSFWPHVNGSSWAADEKLLTGEKIMMINKGLETNGGFEYFWLWGPKMIRDFQAKGFTVMAPADYLFEYNETLEEFLERP